MTENSTSTYLLIVLLGSVIALVVGQVIMRSGRAILSDVFDDPEDAKSATRLLTVLFHLIALGLLATVSTLTPIPVEGVIQTIITKLGLVLITLGVLYGLVLLLLIKVRNRRRNQEIESTVTAQYEQQRQARQTSRQQIIEGGNSR